MSQNPSQEPNRDANRNSNRDPNRDPKPQRPRSTTLRFLSPGPDSSTQQLKVYVAIWTALLILWISAQFWMSDISGFQRALYILLSLVALTQLLSAAGQLRKRR
ncbi:hypothetical protein QMK19_22110 [Streptomyces sp. H10-C2]|uniref:hypothetical protein n=1 Tax=unclassified Streptomyces TaxID=2593676 RepID=UPI0024BBB463|nr:MULTISPECIES: hypothetical protein [unclassified Streptomyces]MDJ0342430.1 hypothetical protein [Streptomyces sp. PH10-H1]MDJ0372285.1 hypothetical protein [Streptomyces sp. H10-C2]